MEKKTVEDGNKLDMQTHSEAKWLTFLLLLLAFGSTKRLYEDMLTVV